MMSRLARRCLIPAFLCLQLAVPEVTRASPDHSESSGPASTAAPRSQALPRSQASPVTDPTAITKRSPHSQNFDESPPRCSNLHLPVDAAPTPQELHQRALALYDANRLPELVSWLAGAAERTSSDTSLQFILAKSHHRLEQFDLALDIYWAIVRSPLPAPDAPGILAERFTRSKALLNIASIHQSLAEQAIAYWGRMSIPSREQTSVQERSRSVASALTDLRRAIPGYANAESPQPAPMVLRHKGVRRVPTEQAP